MFCTYVLYSESSKIFYVGQTGDLAKRFAAHNEPNRAGTKFTLKHMPWKLIHAEEFPTRSDAMKREKFLKSGQGREWLKKQFRQMG